MTQELEIVKSKMTELTENQPSQTSQPDSVLKNNQNYITASKNTTESVSSWLRGIQWDDLIKIQNNCGSEVMKNLGYHFYQNYSQKKENFPVNEKFFYDIETDSFRF